jgi:hypothetical protein
MIWFEHFDSTIFEKLERLNVPFANSLLDQIDLLL